MIKSVIIAVIGLIVVVGIFMLLRNFFSWYKKTNEQIKLAKQQIEYLKTISNQNTRIMYSAEKQTTQNAIIISRLDTMLKIQKLNK